MDRFLQMVEEPSQQDEVPIDEVKLKQFLTSVKVLEYAGLIFIDYQKLSVDDRSSILMNYYVDMLIRFSSGSGKIFFIFFLFGLVLLLFLLLLFLFLYSDIFFI